MEKDGPLPDIRRREPVLNEHTRKVPMAGGVDVNSRAPRTRACWDAGFANHVQEAALWASRPN